jgi:GWxTD domain-containing protein
VEGLLFYHPAVWWVSHVIRTERENCCDDVVVNLRGDAHGYAQALTALEQKRIASEAVMAATGGSLTKRVKRLLRPEETASGGIWVPALAAAILIVSLAVALPARHISQEAQSQWDKWLNEDVVYIISDQEKAAFERLATDEERQHFVEQFWERRDPTPGTPENEFKEEHYRRIAYANSHWAKGTAGWKSDRGRIYIKFGPPDEIDSHPKGGSWIRPESEGGGTVMTYPFEDWRYYHFEGLGSLSIEFVDATGTGDLRMILDPKAKYRK